MVTVPAVAVPAQAAASTRCTITSAERAATADQMYALTAQMSGHKPTADEKAALRSVITELVTAARDGKLDAAQVRAKRAEYSKLAASLDTTSTAAERVAVRAEMAAIHTELKAAWLTPAERPALAASTKALRIALAARPVKAQKAAIRTQIRELAVKLRCRTV
jgi:hypothetical protein